MHWRDEYAAALPFARFVESASANRDLWAARYRLAKIPAGAVARLDAIPGRRHLLILAADWCGDAVNTVPLLVRLAEATTNLDARLLTRDEHPRIMNAHLTNGSRSIPVVMVLDEVYRELGWWGPRPRELQEWVIRTGLALPKDVRYRMIRSWYARDRDHTTVEEVTSLIEHCAARDAGPAGIREPLSAD